MLERACKELDLPLHMTHHNLTFLEYQKEIARCSFIVSPLYEMSTGGMSLLEAYYLGKPCLISDSPWHGGRDYVNTDVRYFYHKSYEDLKHTLQTLWDLDREDYYYLKDNAREYVQNNFSQKRMIGEMVERIKEHQ